MKKTTSEWIWDGIGYLFFFGSIVLMIVVWSWLPEKVPAHYNGAGVVDRWGSKGILLIMPIISLFMALILETLERYPELHNYPKRLNESNAGLFYLVSRKLMNKLKNVFLIILALVQYESISIALHWWHGFGPLFLFMAVVGFSIPVLIAVIGFRKIK